MDLAYLALQPALERALLRCAKNRRAFGRFALFAYLPGSNQLYGTLLYWIIALRSVALGHGRVLFYNPSIRRRRERQLRRAVSLAARHALDHAYIPTGWVAALKPPVLALVFFPIVITLESWHVVVFLCAIAALFVLRTRAQRRHATRFVHVFGQDLEQRLNNLLNPDSKPRG
jgi:hypothetical protein